MIILNIAMCLEAKQSGVSWMRVEDLWGTPFLSLKKTNSTWGFKGFIYSKMCGLIAYKSQTKGETCKNFLLTVL